MEIQLGKRKFTSKKSAIEFCWKFIKKNKGRINNESDVKFCEDLISRHINAREKIGCGVDYFYIAMSPEYNQKCFYIMRKDGSFTDFGVSACFSSKSAMNESDMRRIVQYQIDAYKSRFNGQGVKHFISEYSGEAVPLVEMNCDHVIPFKWIAAKFCQIHGINLKEDLIETFDNDSTPSFKTKDINEKWRDFHKLFPLRVVSKNENLSALTIYANKKGKDFYMKEIEKILSSQK